MFKEITSGKTCELYGCENPQYVLIQPCDEADLKGDEKEYELVSRDKAVAIAAFKVGDWNRELSPWTAPPAFGH